MGDLPLLLLALTVSAYWFIVGAMAVRIRRRTRRLDGVVPTEPRERIMSYVWVPLVIVWIALPWLAQTHRDAPFGLPAFAQEPPVYPLLRWGAALAALLCLAVTIKAWRRMGRNWRMAVSLEAPAEIITDGLFARIRHPIYAFQILLMLSSLVIVPTPAMAIVAAVEITLLNLKARNEERVLLATGGATYARYLARTGRFLPRGGEPGA
jgi:protein-S-isoprenylcysteine O-methyltransferase Ste14